jgi:hypothetical protein
LIGGVKVTTKQEGRRRFYASLFKLPRLKEAWSKKPVR